MPNWLGCRLQALWGAQGAQACRALCGTGLAVACRHFGEPPPACNGMCDICSAAPAGRTLQDFTPAAQSMLAVLEAGFKAQKRATLTQLLDAWGKNRVSPSWQTLAKNGNLKRLAVHRSLGYLG